MEVSRDGHKPRVRTLSPSAIGVLVMTGDFIDIVLRLGAATAALGIACSLAARVRVAVVAVVGRLEGVDAAESTPSRTRRQAHSS